jgi:hypothetical protein
MVPARERLDAYRLLGPQIDLELIVDLELAAGEGGAQVVLERAAVLQAAVHLRLEEAEGVAPLVLGAIERNVGVLEKASGLLSIARGERHADAGRGDDLVAIEVERLDQRREQAATKRLRLIRLLDPHLNERKLVAADARERVDLAYARLEPSRAQFEQPVAGRVPKGVVDALEAVQIEEQDRNHAITVAQASQRVIQPLAQQLAVGQVRDRIVQGKVAGALLSCDLRRDVAGDPPVAEEASGMVEAGFAGEAQNAAPARAVLQLAKDVAERQPCLHGAAQIDDVLGVISFVEQLPERARQERLRREPHDLGEALREKDEASIGIRLPDPVRARVGDIAKAGFARADGERRLPRIEQDEPGKACHEPEGEEQRGQDVADELPSQPRRLPGKPTQIRPVRGAERQHDLRLRLGWDEPQIGELKAFGNRSEEVAVEKLGVDQDGAGSTGRIDRLGRLRCDRACAEDRDGAIEREIARDCARLVAWYEPRRSHQSLEPRHQLKPVHRAPLALDRCVAGAIVAADDEGHVVAKGLVDVLPDVAVRPGQVEVKIEIADGVVPPGIVLRRARDLLDFRSEGAAGGANGLLLCVLGLARCAIGDEGHDGEHGRGEQGQDGKRHLPPEAVGPMLISPASSGGQVYKSPKT